VHGGKGLFRLVGRGEEGCFELPTRENSNCQNANCQNKYKYQNQSVPFSAINPTQQTAEPDEPSIPDYPLTPQQLLGSCLSGAPGGVAAAERALWIRERQACLEVLTRWDVMQEEVCCVCVCVCVCVHVGVGVCVRACVRGAG